MQANPVRDTKQQCCLKMVFLQIMLTLRRNFENSMSSDRIIAIRKIRQQQKEVLVFKNQFLIFYLIIILIKQGTKKEEGNQKMQQVNQLEYQNRYIIDVRRVHQEISNGPNTSCKYCGLYDSKYHCGFSADLLLPDIYQNLSNKGFFRSGKYFWKQNPYLSCCKEYAIRMNVQKFQINEKQKKTYQKFAKLMHENKSLDNFVIPLDSQKPQLEINGLQIQGNESNQQLNNQNKQKQIGDHIDPNNQLLEQLLTELQLKLFNEQKGFKTSQIPFKIFKTKGKKSDSDYYSNILQVVSIQNKEVVGSIDQLIEKYQKEIINILEKKSQSFSYSIHPEKNFLLFNERNKTKQIDQEIKKISNININGTEKCLVSNQKNQNYKQKVDQNKEQKGIINKVKQSYVNNDGSLIFDEFSFRYIRIGDLEITLVNNDFNEEIYQIHCDYFKHVHQRDPQSDQKFADDKCVQIIEPKILESKIDPNQKLYTGTFFFEYRFKGKLIAASHVDILPQMFLSQYFFYKPEFKKTLKLGINSALIEIEYVKRMQKFFPEFLYFNFVQFIPRTTKMNYKADFQKQEILCPETNRWVDLTLEMKKQLYENPADNPRLAPKEWAISPDHNFSDMNIEEYLYQNFLMYINEKYLMIQDLIPESQPQILINLACILQAMGKTIFNQLTFGY